MCGRFTLRTKAGEIARQFRLADLPELSPRGNICPTQTVAAVRLEGGSRKLAMLRWGLIPSWAKDQKTGYTMINARAETVAIKPAYSGAFKKRRCLILADGFYEWQTIGKKKQPYWFHFEDNRPFGMAGLWDLWRRDDTTIESCTIIVTSANATVEKYHDRMPVILPPEEHDLWLDAEFENSEKLQQMLRPYTADELKADAVNNEVFSQ